VTADLDTGAPADDAGAPSGALSRIIGVLFAPDATFASIARRPTIAGAMTILVVISLICSALTTPRIDFTAQSRQEMAKRTDLSAEQKEAGLRWGAAFYKAIGYAGPVFLIAWWAIVAAILLLLFRLFGADGSYQQAFAIRVYSSVPTLIGKIVLTIVVLARGHVTNMDLATLVRSNLGFLVDPVKQRVAFIALASLDVFTIWSLILATIGFSYMANRSKGVAGAVVFGLKIVGMTIFIGIVAVGMQFQKS
jgi:hypothetical protein